MKTSEEVSDDSAYDMPGKAISPSRDRTASEEAEKISDESKEYFEANVKTSHVRMDDDVATSPNALVVFLDAKFRLMSEFKNGVQAGLKSEHKMRALKAVGQKHCPRTLVGGMVGNTPYDMTQTGVRCDTNSVYDVAQTGCTM